MRATPIYEAEALIGPFWDPQLSETVGRPQGRVIRAQLHLEFPILSKRAIRKELSSFASGAIIRAVFSFNYVSPVYCTTWYGETDRLENAE